MDVPQLELPNVAAGKGVTHLDRRATKILWQPFERARQEPEWRTLLSLPDALFSALPTLRQAVLNHPLEDALRRLGAQ